MKGSIGIQEQRMEQRHTLKNGTSGCHAGIVHQHVQLPLHLHEEEKHCLQAVSVL